MKLKTDSLMCAVASAVVLTLAGCGGGGGGSSGTVASSSTVTVSPALGKFGAGARITFDDAGHVYFVVGHFVDYRGIQDLDFPYGKIMRVHDDGRIPADNPFVKVAGAIPAIYTLGHRVVQGLDFDRATGRVWATEHGPRGGDELNWIRSGVNYGWPVISEGVDYDGRPIHYGEELGIQVDRSTLERPKVFWTPSPGASSLVFYRGAAFPKWQDHAIIATLSKNELWRYVLDANGEVEHETLIAGLGRIRDVAAHGRRALEDHGRHRDPARGVQELLAGSYRSIRR